MPRPTTTPQAYQLLHQGMEALATISANGMRVDRGYVDQAIKEAEGTVAELVAQIAADPMAKVWRRRYREQTNFLSPNQLAHVVFGEMGFQSRGKTALGTRDAADEKAFVHIQEQLPIIKTLFAARKARNAADTFLTGIRREAIQHADGCWYIHPFFHLNTTATHRSSASDPNPQNQPARNPIMAEIVRRCYIPRPGCQITEVDLGQIEARMPCPYTGDPVLMSYVSDPNSDMHKDMAAQIFEVDKGLVSKQLRQLVKGAYVFATFYGSYWGQTAPALWEGIDNPASPIKLTDGTLVRDHLTSLGFTELGDLTDGEPAPGTWAAHLRGIDRHFWGERFKVYAQWKRDWWDRYLQNGGFQMLTGFAVCLPLDRKQVCNSPIQGSSFHVVLRALPLINKWLDKYKMKTRVICEIHDSVIADGPPEERDDYINACMHYLTTDVMRAWKWINVPIVAEPECCPVDQSWYDKMALVSVPGGMWAPADIGRWEEKYGPWADQCR